MKALLLMVPVLLASCASGFGAATPTTPSAQQLLNADYGPDPGTSIEAVVKQFLEPTLFDPFSAVYRVQQPPKRMWVLRNGAPIYGYGTCIAINAKNRMGGYVGFKSRFFLINGGVVVFDSYATMADYQFCIEGTEFIRRTSEVAAVLGA